MPDAPALEQQAPQSDINLYADGQLLDPWAGYDQLREQGGAVWLTRLGMYVLTRYADVKGALANWETFSSGRGVMLNDILNEAARGNTLCSDGDQHDAQRRIVLKPLTPKTLRPMEADITSLADELVDRLVAGGSFDAVADLAAYLPVTVVANLVGLPEEGREHMLTWATELFNCFGPKNERMESSLPVLGEVMEYITTKAVPGKLKPGGWAEAIHLAADRGEIDRNACPVMMLDYLGPSLDTTINAIASAVWLFAEHPDQWDLVRQDPSLVGRALNEVLRMEAPIQGWSRYLERACEVDGVDIPAGSRALLLWGAANRDPREFAAPNEFNVLRNSVGHLGFGHGPHACVGMNLAKIEIKSLLTALARRVERFEVTESERMVNNVLRGFKTLRVSVR